MDTVNTAMHALNLSEELSREIVEFFITTHATHELQTELNDFMKKRISKTYRVSCNMFIFKECVY